MWFPLYVILTALTLYLLNNSSTRSIPRFLMRNCGIKVSHVTISNWQNKFAPFCKHMASDINNDLIEVFNKTFKAWYKAKKGFNSQRTSNFIKCYANFS
jgi:hypothetical protein